MNKKYRILTSGQTAASIDAFLPTKGKDFLYISFYINIHDANIENLEKAYNHMLKTQDGLRIKCAYRPYLKQYIEEFNYEHLPVIEIENDSMLNDTISKYRNFRSYFSHNVLHKAIIIKSKETLNVTLFMVFHHVCFDGYSINLAFKYIEEYYELLQNNKDLPTYDKQYTFDEHINKYIDYRKSNIYKDDIKFWKTKINDNKNLTILDPRMNCVGKTIKFNYSFDKNSVMKLNSLCKQLLVPTYFAIVALFMKEVYNDIHKNDIPLFYMSHARKNFLSKKTMGALLDTFIFYFHINDNESTADYLKRSFLEYLEFYKHCGVSIIDLIPVTLKSSIRNKTINYYNNIISVNDYTTNINNYKCGIYPQKYQYFKTYTSIKANDENLEIIVLYQDSQEIYNFIHKYIDKIEKIINDLH